jgi:hypothetical protein
MKVEHAEEAAKIAAEYRELEQALQLLTGARSNQASIRSLLAEDAAETERSVHLQFTKEESDQLFQTAMNIVMARFVAIKDRMEKL